MSRRMNDGNATGMKQDRYRHSDFEFQKYSDSIATGGVSEKTLNTLGGISAENRGRRGDDPRSKEFNQDNPFENSALTNWGNRNGWDRFFYEKSFRPGHAGGSLIRASDEGRFAGVGPKGWKRLDENIFEDVCETLARSQLVDASDIEVEVKEGCVYLRGTVEDRQTKRQAEYEIENISGVTDVQNRLTIKTGDVYDQE